MKKCVSIFPDVQRSIIIDCVVGVPDYEDPSLDSRNIVCKALIDTGAQLTCISSHLADYLSMIPSGTMKVTAANNHTDVVNTHIINISMGSEIRIEMLKVPRLTMTGEDMIIGMDILSKGNTIINNDPQKGTIFMFEYRD